MKKKDIICYHEPTDCTPNTTQGLLKAHTFDSMNDRFGFAEVRWLLWASVLTWGGGCFEMFSWYRWGTPLVFLSWQRAGIWHLLSSSSFTCAPLWTLMLRGETEQGLAWLQYPPGLRAGFSELDCRPAAVAVFVSSPSGIWQCHERLGGLLCCWNLAVLSMMPMNGVLRGLCSVVPLCAWLVPLSLIRESGPWTLNPSEKLLLEVKLLVELDIFMLLDGDPEEPELVREAGCCASLPLTGLPWLGGAKSMVMEAWARSRSAALILLGRG